MALVLITGCSSGFGRLAAFEFARRGDRVYATVRRETDGDALERDACDRSLSLASLVMDVTDTASITRAVGQCVDRDGDIDVLINNAGMTVAGAFEDLPEADIDRIMQTNFLGPVRVTRAVLPAMRARQRGRIIMVSSLSALAGRPGDAFYAASKAALERATESLRAEVAPFGIHVSLVEPGLYATQMPTQLAARSFDASDSPYASMLGKIAAAQAGRLGEAADPAEVARLLVDIANTVEPLLHYPAGEQAAAIYARVFRMSPAEHDQWLKSISPVD